jgi:hypothetical protein
MMNTVTVRAFCDELIQIKVASFGRDIGTIGQAGSKLLRAGWSGTKADPIGGWGKALTMVGPTLSLPGALAEEDPSGQGRSRAERMVGLGGNVAASMMLGGGLAHATAPLQNKYLAGAAQIGGGLALGPMTARAGEEVATAPWAMKRWLQKRFSPQQQGPAEAAPLDGRQA